MTSLLHGAVGYLDELLACGVLIAVGLGLYFVFALIERGRGKQSEEKDEHF